MTAWQKRTRYVTHTSRRFLSLGCALICWRSLRRPLDDWVVVGSRSRCLVCGPRSLQWDASRPSGPSLALASGARLGPYEIVGPLGVGGMGEVYRATDTRLERVVAIKVLPDGITASPQTLERFQREARAASALNHPNICTIYDVGTDPPFIAMELLEGETLQQRLRRGPMEVPVLVDIAVAVADALDAAHSQGHRASRHQAGEHFPDAARTEDSRFRAREGGVRTGGDRRLRSGRPGRRRRC